MKTTGTWYMVLQESGGCDYTIRCGLDLISLFKGTIEEGEKAKITAKKLCFDDYKSYFTGDRKVTDLFLVFDPGIELSLSEWKEEILENEQKEEEAREEEEEKKQLRKLQEKYGK
jgi:hypothetical protein